MYTTSSILSTPLHSIRFYSVPLNLIPWIETKQVLVRECFIYTGLLTNQARDDTKVVTLSPQVVHPWRSRNMGWYHLPYKRGWQPLLRDPSVIDYITTTRRETKNENEKRMIWYLYDSQPLFGGESLQQTREGMRYSNRGTYWSSLVEGKIVKIVQYLLHECGSSLLELVRSVRVGFLHLCQYSFHVSIHKNGRRRSGLEKGKTKRYYRSEEI